MEEKAWSESSQWRVGNDYRQTTLQRSYNCYQRNGQKVDRMALPKEL